MPEQPVAALQRALDEMEHLRKRSLIITRILLLISVPFFCVSCALLLFSQNKWLGMYFAVSALYGFVGALGVNLGGLSNTNTQRILKAIDALSRRQAE